MGPKAAGFNGQAHAYTQPWPLVGGKLNSYSVRPSLHPAARPRLYSVLRGDSLPVAALVSFHRRCSHLGPSLASPKNKAGSQRAVLQQAHGSKGVATIFCLLEVAILVWVSLNRERHTRASIPAAAVDFVAALGLVLLIFLEHTRSQRSSLLTGLYLSLTLLLRAARARTLWFLYGGGFLASTSIAALVVQLLLLAIDSYTRLTHAPSSKPSRTSPEESSGFLGRSLLSWILSLLLRGYRGSLDLSNLGPIDTSLASAALTRNFSRFISGHENARVFLVSSFRAVGWYSFSPVIPRLCLSGFTFAQPFLTSAVIDYLNESSSSDFSGRGLIGAAALIYTGMAVSTAWYWNTSYKVSVMIRGGILDSISQKLLTLSISEKGAEAKALTLMVSDVQRVVAALAYVHELWVSPVETAIGTWLLWRQLGPSSLTVLAVALVSTTASIIVGKHIATQQGNWLAATEKRMAATKRMLSSMKAIKMLGSNRSVHATLEKLRLLEFAASKIFRRLIVGSLIASYSTVTLAPVVVFGAYIGTTLQNNDFDAARMFSSLVLITLISAPLIRLLQIIPSFGSAFACAGRLAEFFRKEPKQEPRSAQQHTSDSETLMSVDMEQAEKETLISVVDGSFGWARDVSPMLTEINLNVRRGQHVVIKGAVGSGKSLLLQSLLGESANCSGEINVRGTVGYCSQTPWLENVGASDVVFSRAADDLAEAAHLQRVITDACALDSFLGTQTSGSTIGSAGAKLSGGERQRLAIARAITTRPSILLLDDVFSAIDQRTKEYMTARLFGPEGMARKWGITVLQTTHDDFIAQLADEAFAITPSGHLGPYAPPTRVATGADVATLSSQETTAPKTVESQQGPTKTMNDRQVYRAYFRSIGHLQMMLFFIGGIAFAFCLRFPDVWAMWWTNASTGPSSSNAKSVGYWIGIYALLNVLPLIVVGLWVMQLMLFIVPRSGVQLHEKLLRTVLNAKFAFLSAVDTGSLVNRFNQDLMFVDSKLPIDLLNTAATLFTCTAQVILIVVSAVYLLASIPVLALVLVLTQHFYLRTSKQLRVLDLESKAALQSKLSETLSGLPTIRAHGWQDSVHRDFQSKIDDSQRPVYLLYMVQTWLRFVMNMLVAGLSVLVIGVAVALRQSRPDATSAAGIGVAVLNIASLGESLTNLLTAWTSLETSLACIARIEGFEQSTPLEKEPSDPTPPDHEWPSAGRITLNHVYATYHVQSEEKETVWALEDICLDIKPGERVAICGETGSGKSSLLLSLLSLIDTPLGSISIDGVDVANVTLERLRSSFLVISQDVLLHGLSVRDTLDPDGNVEGDDRVVAVLEECGVWKPIEASGGLAATLDQVTLSAGEMQLLALARIVLEAGAKRAGIVLFDEAMSSIDVATEKRITELVGKTLKGRTVISILHRLEAALEYDRIVVLDQGRVVHDGRPEEVREVAELFASYRG
ncbi:hypothetical protein PG993_006205 [Apiospora rasikravindrae]|uniref:ABC transporter n=1 Tax=Apiospora rasikravindrae TaxID=990691 RepID=A0ABR1T517_9PEZI